MKLSSLSLLKQFPVEYGKSARWGDRRRLDWARATKVLWRRRAFLRLFKQWDPWTVPRPIQNTWELACHAALPGLFRILGAQHDFHHHLHCYWCFIGKRPKKGMATAKQRLGKILKLNRNGHARFFVWWSCHWDHSSLWRPVSGVREPGASAVRVQ